jgi:hypothetical protein
LGAGVPLPEVACSDFSAKEFEMPNVYEIIRDHVSLSISCIDRIYVNGYIATLQVPGQLCLFMRDHLGQPIPSPAVLRPIHDRFVAGVEEYAQRHRTPVVHF